MKKICFLFFIFYFLFSPQAFAQSKVESPHTKVAVQTGTIVGTLYKDGKTPLPGHEVKLEIVKGNELVLVIPKATDPKGGYQFKNIFQTDEFSYAISAEHEGNTYHTDFISLKTGEKLRKLNLVVGEGGTTAPQLPAATAGAEERPAFEKIRSNEYVLLAVLLSVLAAGYAIYQRRK